MPLPQNCCCCVQLDIGSHILNGLSIFGHTSVLIETLLDFDSYEYATEDAGIVMHVSIVVWCLVSIFISLLLTLGIATSSLNAMKTYLVVGLAAIIPALVRNGYVLSSHPVYGIKLMVLNAICIYQYIIGYTVYTKLKRLRLKSDEMTMASYGTDPSNIRIRQINEISYAI